MQQHRRVVVSDDNACPVSDATLSRLYRADAAEIGTIARGLDGDVRTRLAIFCFSRAHLRKIGRAVAAECDEAKIRWHAGGPLGDSIIAARSTGAPAAQNRSHRPKVTLARASDMRQREPLVDIEEE